MADGVIPPPLRPARATIDLTRLAANYRALTALVPVPLMPVVKADAYGHGAVPVARHLVALGAPLLAVAYVEEGVALRRAGIRVPVVVLAGFTAGQAPLLVGHDLVPVVSTPATLQAVLDLSARITVHLKVDTGMARLGFAPADIAPAADRLLDSRRVEIAGLLTHLASADEDPEATRRQLDLFDTVVASLAAQGLRPPLIHASNSAGMAYHRATHTLARPGLLLYGVRPRPLSPAAPVRPVMSLTAAVAAVKEVPAGSGVSYGGRFVTRRPSRIAVLPVGYADGVPRTVRFAEAGHVVVRGRPLPIAGTVCMDLTLVDATDCPEVRPGDEAILMGDSPDAWDIADWAGTNGWEALTRVGPRVPRVYVEDGRIVEVAPQGETPVPIVDPSSPAPEAY